MQQEKFTAIELSTESLNVNILNWYIFDKFTLPEEMISKNRNNANIPIHLIVRPQNIWNEGVSVSQIKTWFE